MAIFSHEAISIAAVWTRAAAQLGADATALLAAKSQGKTESGETAARGRPRGHTFDLRNPYPIPTHRETDREGALYHITSRGNERRPIFRNNADRKVFLRFLGQTATRFGWSVTAFVLMTNHFHLLIQTSEPNLSRTPRRKKM